MESHKSLRTIAALLKRSLTRVSAIGTSWYEESLKLLACDKIYKHSHKKSTKDSLIRPNWFELPDDNLEEILSKIDTSKGYMIFTAVCKSWGSIAHNMNYRVSRFNLPMYHFLPKKNALPMLLQPCGEGDDVHYLYSTTNRKVYGGLHVPELSNKWTPGSANGWLVTIDMNDLQINLLNPLTRVQIPLPPVSAFQKPTKPHLHGDTNHFMFVSRVYISSDPVADRPNCLFVALVSSINTLSFCRIGDHRWQKLEPAINRINDVIMYKGLLYAVDWHSRIFTIEIYPHIEVTLIAEGYIAEWRNEGQRYLVESASGELLLVVRLFRGFGGSMKTAGFKVYKLVEPQHNDGHPQYMTEERTIHRQEEAIQSTWKEIQNLDGQMLFVGYNRCKLFDPCLYPGNKKDCIYFTDDVANYDICRVRHPYKDSHDIGLYDMEFQKIESLSGLDESSSKMSSIWFSPNPW